MVSTLPEITASAIIPIAGLNIVTQIVLSPCFVDVINVIVEFNSHSAVSALS